MPRGSARLKRKWEAGEAVFGPFIQLPAPGLVEIFAHAGFDLVVIDLEHGPISLETAENMIRAADVHGIASGVRVLANRPELITGALVLGADAVLVPHVSNAAEARAAVEAARFAPLGSRGVSPSSRSASYSAAKGPEYYEQANASVIVNVLLEGVEALEALDEVLEVPGLDVVSMAPYDLSQSLGVTGQIDHPLVRDAVADACRRAQGRGKVVCSYIERPSAARQWLDLGVQWLTAAVDAGMIYAAARDWRAELQQELDRV